MDNKDSNSKNKDNKFTKLRIINKITIFMFLPIDRIINVLFQVNQSFKIAILKNNFIQFLYNRKIFYLAEMDKLNKNKISSYEEIFRELIPKEDFDRELCDFLTHFLDFISLKIKKKINLFSWNREINNLGFSEYLHRTNKVKKLKFTRSFLMNRPIEIDSIPKSINFENSKIKKVKIDQVIFRADNHNLFCCLLEKISNMKSVSWIDFSTKNEAHFINDSQLDMLVNLINNKSGIIGINLCGLKFSMVGEKYLINFFKALIAKKDKIEYLNLNYTFFNINSFERKVFRKEEVYFLDEFFDQNKTIKEAYLSQIINRNGCVKMIENYHQRLVSKLVKCYQLEGIQIDNLNSLCKETDVIIKEFIPNCENLIRLNLSFLDVFSKNDMEYFSAGLKNLKLMKHLDISGNQIQNADEQLNILMNSISKINSLEELVLRYIYFNANQAKILASGIKKCINLKKLDIVNSNLLDYENFNYFIDIIEKTVSIRKLVLSYDRNANFNNKKYKIFTQLLENANIEVIDIIYLNGNNRDDRLISLIRYLESNKNLKRIRIQNNIIKGSHLYEFFHKFEPENHEEDYSFLSRKLVN